ncbi:molybdopterin biosynthesis protein moeA [Vibrio ishigakensis]|uniref:Molybdopterin biosynthesis protein moeA n=1 Tax=Vibrio ishigakensis TaxID=1481914 RepID=A0A0B8NPH3_9VIBR|nr:molybdopterin biosynthesis protein moeA [Vibrio ishigakensis]
MGCCDAPGLMPIEEAMPIILKNTPVVTETETLAIEDAIGRVLAHDVSSPLMSRLLITQQWTATQFVLPT